MNPFFLGILILLFLILALGCIKEMVEAPKLIGELPKDINNVSMHTYTIINSLGEKEFIMTSLSMEELLTELDKLSDNQNT